ncbi:MAG: hypothetical protein JXA71_06340, partial [Chitinispirillaceae bacterium]|nr:hypothetical protein [Chitinispirillaceae bacterium]
SCEALHKGNFHVSSRPRACCRAPHYTLQGSVIRLWWFDNEGPCFGYGPVTDPAARCMVNAAD